MISILNHDLIFKFNVNEIIYGFFISPKSQIEKPKQIYTMYVCVKKKSINKNSNVNLFELEKKDDLELETCIFSFENIHSYYEIYRYTSLNENNLKLIEDEIKEILKLKPDWKLVNSTTIDLNTDIDYEYLRDFLDTNNYVLENLEGLKNG